ncbi:hypothetical protein EVAR_14903_1 [Eumeta japonica]|uniref:Uncharacterized protein n=1 Tax=Eumeta variegata TaxID=151549 RepID=A0A4C1XQ57_EUMVA|nr:hypothetical protein EVAR_14903_1 [Eumeta japonica]
MRPAPPRALEVNFWGLALACRPGQRLRDPRPAGEPPRRPRVTPARPHAHTPRGDAVRRCHRFSSGPERGARAGPPREYSAITI